MRKLILLLLLLSLVIAVPVSAVVINTTILFPTNYEGTLSSDGLLGINSYLFTSPSGYVITLGQIGLGGAGSTWNSDGILHFTFTSIKGNATTGNITTETSIANSRLKPSFVGGTTASSGSNFFGIGFLCPPITFFYAYSQDNGKWYFIAAESSRVKFNPYQITREGSIGQFNLDLVNDAYIELSTAPTNNVLTKFDASSQTMKFSALTWYEKLDVLKTHETNTINYYSQSTIPPSEDWIAKVIELISAILAAGYRLIDFGATVGVYFITGVLFLFLGQVVLTLFAAYTLIAAVLSIHDSDSLFVSIGKFYRYELKLWRFFTIELIKTIKDIMKWW